MAGDWLPVRLHLHSDPAVITISAATGLDAHAVVGRLVALWSWANEHTADGRFAAGATGITVEWVDRFLGCTGFATAMIAAGWLVLDDPASGRIAFPAYDTWNSESAKKRLKKSSQRRRQRGGSTVATLSPQMATVVAVPGDRKATTEEKRREESKTPHTPRGAGGGGGPTPQPTLKAFDPEANPIALPFERLLDAWAAAGLTGGAHITATATRRGRWQQRLADPDWAARWAEAVARAGRSARCRVTPEWRLTIDAFLKEPDLVCRLLEGEFDTAAESGIPRPSFEQFQKRYGG